MIVRGLLLETIRRTAFAPAEFATEKPGSNIDREYALACFRRKRSALLEIRFASRDYVRGGGTADGAQRSGQVPSPELLDGVMVESSQRAEDTAMRWIRHNQHWRDPGGAVVRRSRTAAQTAVRIGSAFLLAALLGLSSPTAPSSAARARCNPPSSASRMATSTRRAVPGRARRNRRAGAFGRHPQAGAAAMDQQRWVKSHSASLSSALQATARSRNSATRCSRAWCRCSAAAPAHFTS